MNSTENKIVLKSVQFSSEVQGTQEPSIVRTCLIQVIQTIASSKNKMRCNGCWKELEGRVITTTCGHLLCTEDASKILSSDGACPICDQVLSKSQMKPVDINPSDEWVNMAMVGLNPQILMKSVYKSIMFYIQQKELEMQVKMNRMAAQCRQKCETMQAKFSEKLEQVHGAYQKMAKRCQMMAQEIDNLNKDKQELQDKFAEKSRQKRKLDEMYDQLRNEYESVKRSSIRPSTSFYQRQEHDLLADTGNMMGTRNLMDSRSLMDNRGMMDNRGPMRNEWANYPPKTPGPREDIWAPKQTSTSSFDLPGGSPAKKGVVAVDSRRRSFGTTSHSAFAGGANNPSMTLRNLILSPIKRPPQLSRNHPPLFT